MDQWLESQLQIIRNTEVDQQIKLICIIELMYRKDISLYQAYRLLTDIGLLSEDWRYLVQQAVTLYEELYRTQYE